MSLFDDLNRSGVKRAELTAFQVGVIERLGNAERETGVDLDPSDYDEDTRMAIRSALQKKAWEPPKTGAFEAVGKQIVEPLATVANDIVAHPDVASMGEVYEQDIVPKAAADIAKLDKRRAEFEKQERALHGTPGVLEPAQDLASTGAFGTPEAPTAFGRGFETIFGKQPVALAGSQADIEKQNKERAAKAAKAVTDAEAEALAETGRVEAARRDSVARLVTLGYSQEEARRLAHDTASPDDAVTSTAKAAYGLGGQILKGVAYAGDKTWEAIAGDVTGSDWMREAGKRYRFDPESNKHLKWVSDLQIVGSTLFGEEGEEAANIIAGGTARAVADPTLLVGGPALRAAGRAARSLHGARLVEAANIGINPAADIARAEKVIAKLGAPEELAYKWGDQVRSKQASALRIAGVPIEVVPGVRQATAKLADVGDLIFEAAKKKIGPEGARKLANGYRIRGFLSPEEQDAIVVSRLQMPKVKRLAKGVEDWAVSEAEGLKAEAARFDIRSSGTDVNAQRRALAKVYEEGPGDLLDMRIKQGIKNREINGAEGNFLRRLRKKNEELLKHDISIGVDIDRLDEGTLTYVHHAGTKEFRALTQKLFGHKYSPSEIMTTLIGDMQHAATKKRKLKDMGIFESNDLAEDALRKYAAREGIELPAELPRMFHEDLVLATAARELATIKATGSYDFAMALKKLFGVDSPTLGMKGRAQIGTAFLKDAARAKREMIMARKSYFGAKGEEAKKIAETRMRWAQRTIDELDAIPNNYTTILDGPLKGTALPSRVADMLSNLREVERSKSHIENAINFYTDWWKKYTLQVRPSFHFRNLISGKISTALEGGLGWRGEQAYAKYKIGGGAEAFGDSSVALPDGSTVKQADIAREYESLGLSKNGMFSSELDSIDKAMKDTLDLGRGAGLTYMARAITGAGATGKLDRVKKIAQAIPFVGTDTYRGPILRWTSAVGHETEQALRFPHYFNRRLKGDAPLEAWQSVIRAHIDYDDIGTAERRMLTLVPFWKWTVGSTVQHGRILASKPGLVAAKEHLVSEMAGEPPGGDTEIPMRLLPKYLQKAGVANVKRLKDGTVKVYTRSGYDPMWEFMKAGDNLEGLQGYLHPLVQAGIGALAGRDSFRERDLETMSTPGIEELKVEYFGAKMTRLERFLLEKLLPGGLQEINRLGLQGGRANDIRGKGGEKPTNLLAPLFEGAEVRESPDTRTTLNKFTQYMLGYRPYEVQLWKEGRTRVAKATLDSNRIVSAIKNPATSDKDRISLKEELVKIQSYILEQRKDYAAVGVTLEPQGLEIPADKLDD